MVMSYTAVQFATYGALTRLLQVIDCCSRPQRESFSFIRYACQTHQPGSHSHAYWGMVGGSIAGLTATCASYPFDLLRTRLAAQHHVKVRHKELASYRCFTAWGVCYIKLLEVCPMLILGHLPQIYPSLSSALRHIYASEGIAGLYHGVLQAHSTIQCSYG